MKNIVHLAALLSLAFILAKPVYGEGGSYEVDGLRIKGMPIRGPQTFFLHRVETWNGIPRKPKYGKLVALLKSDGKGNVELLPCFTALSLKEFTRADFEKHFGYRYKTSGLEDHGVCFLRLGSTDFSFSMYMDFETDKKLKKTLPTSKLKSYRILFLSSQVESPSSGLEVSPFIEVQK